MKSIVVLTLSAAMVMAFDSGTVRPGDLTVHEWGTFTSVAGEDGAALEWDTLGCTSDLPGFVHDSGLRNSKAALQGTVRMETPVLYFYSPREMDAHVKVAFPQGLMTESYPQAEGMDRSKRTTAKVLEWRNIRVQPGTSPLLPVDGRPNRYYEARATDAAPVTVGNEREKFLFYRGVGFFPVPLSARVSNDGKIVVENRGPDAVPAAILFENREGRIGYRFAGAVQNAVSIDAPTLDGSFARLRQELESGLLAQGLFPKEAQAMLETWRDSWFEEGSRLIYIVPAPAIDSILPLQIEPAPSQTVRVFVGRIELLTPETQRTVASAVERNDWPTVERYHRFLDPILKRISSGDPVRGREVEERFRNSYRPAGCP